MKPVLGGHLVLSGHQRGSRGFPLNTGFTVQWNPGLTICQGNVKIISLNRDNDIVGKFHLGKRILIVILGISLYRRSLNRGSTVFSFLGFVLQYDRKLIRLGSQTSALHGVTEGHL